MPEVVFPRNYSVAEEVYTLLRQGRKVGVFYNITTTVMKDSLQKVQRRS